MKQFSSCLTKAGAWAVAAIAASWMFSAQAVEGKATVRAIRNGYADYSEDGKTWKRLAIGHRLVRGNTVRTDKNAQVDLFLGVNGPVVRVTPDTTLEFTTLSFEQTPDEPVINTELGMSNGRILGNVKKLAAASKYEVKTPGGVCAVRGTQFDVTFRAGLPMKVTVIEGTVTVRYGTQTFTVTAGNTFDASANNGQGEVMTTPPAVENQNQGEHGQMDYVITITTPGAEATIVIPQVKPPDQPPVQEPTTKT